MDKLIEIPLLLDFYGNLLTDRQKMIMSYHYEEDMSLGEISEELMISRQAVHDIIKRTAKSLRDYEEKLGLINRSMAQKEKLLKLRRILLEEQVDDRLKAAVKLIDDIIEM